MIKSKLKATNNIIKKTLVRFDDGYGPLPKKMSSEEAINLSEEDYQKLTGREKSRVTLIRNRFHKMHPDVPTNQSGRNQYTEENKIKKYITDSLFKAKDLLNSALPNVIEIAVSIAADPKEKTLDRLKACELIIAYQLAKPIYKERQADDSSKTFIILPADSIIDKTKVIDVDRVLDTESRTK